MQNLFIINRFEHIESKELIDFIIYSQNRIFVVFVRVFDRKNTTSHETHFEQKARIDSVLSKMTYTELSKETYESFNLTNFESNEHAIYSMSMQ